MNTEHKFGLSRLLTMLLEYFGLNRAGSLLVVGFIAAVVSFTVFWFVHSAPPRVLTLTSGPPGSAFERYARSYRDRLASNGVTLRILPSQGSLENLERLENPDERVDVGFVQGGVSGGTNTHSLVSLGSLRTNPCWFSIVEPIPSSCCRNWQAGGSPLGLRAAARAHWR